MNIGDRVRFSECGQWNLGNVIGLRPGEVLIRTDNNESHWHGIRYVQKIADAMGDWPAALAENQASIEQYYSH